MSKAYIEKLKAEAEAENLRYEEAKANSLHADPRVVCDIPLPHTVFTEMDSQW